MSEMMERVARAIAASQGWSWHDVNQPLFLKSARAAIEAMREPTPEMTGIYRGMAGNELAHDADRTTIARVWYAMLDAALSRPEDRT